MTYEQLPEAVRRLYPWPGKHLTLEDGHHLHYLDEGAGEPLLMVHGNPTWSFYYRGLVSAFAGEHRAVVPDHIGCGLSDKPQDWPYHLASHTRNLEQLVLKLDLRDITLIGHDWGGGIGFGVALRHPERFKRLIFFNTAVFQGEVPLRISMCRWPGLGALMVRGLNGFLETALQVGFAKRLSKDVAAGYLAPYDSWANRVAIHRFVLDIPMEREHRTWETVDQLDRRSGELAHLPTLIVWGEKDFVFTTKFLDGWRQRFPGAEVRSLPHAAHFVLEDATEEIVGYVRDFLARHPIAPSS
jgi:haloalkane dehalogenase